MHETDVRLHLHPTRRCDMEWLADRFFRLNGTWIDAASGLEVHVLIEDAPSEDTLDWDEQCARLAQVRHPLLNPLLDYGAAPAANRFEAYARLPPVVGGPRLDRVLLHATQFLRRSGITMHGARASVAMRQVAAGRGNPPRPLGVTLQPRHALSVVQEVLESPSAASTVTTVVGPSSAGLRTMRNFVARSARTLGFVPVCSAVLVKHLAGSAATERHFCVLDDDEAPGARDFAGALVRLAAASARRHVVIRFRRLRGNRGAITLDPLSVRSLMGMVFVEPEGGPTEQELFDAARLAEGRPGAFLAQLMGAGAGTSAASTLAVHETPQEYAVIDPQPRAGTMKQPPRRTLQAALRAIGRAEALASRGRHASAERLLLRGSRVLSGRGRPEDAAACLVRAGALALDRGRTREAVRFFDEARALSGSGPAALRAAVGLGEAWIDDLRLVEAEAVLRGALAAADALPDRSAAVAATAALVRCLNSQERASEAVALGAALDWLDEDPAAVSLLAGLSRSHCALGRTASAVRLARRAEALAKSATDAAARVAVDLALAEALVSAGDTTGMMDALARARRGARLAHLPLAAISARLLECEHGAHLPRAGPERDRRRRQLRGLERLMLPRLHRTRVAAAIEALEKSCPPASSLEHGGQDVRREAADALEALLQACHQAQDDAAALAAVCASTVQRVHGATVLVIAGEDRRVLATEGRPWISSSTVISQTLATGQPCVSDAGVEPREAAEPVRHGNEIIAVIACRWSAGMMADIVCASAVLRAAALAAATPARALLDGAPPPPPPGAWGDLLGSSPAAVTLREAVTRAARAPFPVLIEGESGCGKELVARAIHRLSARRDRRFCAVNCAALTDELVETELFGHARGAFTGAAAERAGLFEEADGGTLLLDEVAELSARAQAKLLRVLQEGEVRRVGENFSRRVDARIVTATNRQLGDEVPAGRFRADLRFRLDVVRIAVPPLRERPGDVAILAAHFWNDASQRVGSRAALTGEALAGLARYDWPGNVRELQNVIAWMAVHSPRRGRIGPSALPAHVAQSAMPAARNFAAAREEFERRFVRAALAGADGQMSRAARALGVSRQGLSKMMRRLQIEAPARGAHGVRP